MTIHKWALFEKTSSLILLKIAQMMLIGPLKMSHKSGLGPPSKNFHDGKIEIFGPSQSSTGIKGAADQMLPWKAPNDPKTLPTGILHDYMSYWARRISSSWDQIRRFWGAQKLFYQLGSVWDQMVPFGPPVGTQMAPEWPNIYNLVIYPWEVF